MHTSGELVPPVGEREYLFGPFRLVPARHLLLRDGAPVRLGSRALDILAALLERPGEVLTKRELIARAWPSSVVEESNLKVHVAALRRALDGDGLGTGHIVTVSGRGYSFAGTVGVRSAPPRQAPVHAAAPLPGLPLPLTRTVGRDAVVAQLAATLDSRRLLSIVGPGGIGKTTVALATAGEFAARTGLEPCFVDLSRVASARFVDGTVAAALGLTIHSGDPGQAVVAWLRARQRLLLLDSCENVIDAAAVLAERIASCAPGSVLLVTSREPLRVAGEHVHQLAPLDYPAGLSAPGAAQALHYAAVQLFVERAAEARGGYRMSDADAPAVAEICRRLEGNALAIELAATRIDAFGAIELAARLDDRFRLLRRGRRGAQPRHRSLEAALDWSYEFLPPAQRAILRGLGVFAHAFEMDAAIGLLAAPALDAAALVDGIGDLVAKSLVAADLGGERVHYRLLDTTRAYALEKLEQEGEADGLRRRHAELTLGWLRRGGEAGGFAPGAGGTGRAWLQDLRAALAWAWEADTALGVALTVAAIPLWMHLSLMDECRQACAHALAGGASGLAPADAMRLEAALAGATQHSCGPLPQVGESWTRTLALAETLGDDEYQLRALWGLGMYRGYVGEYRAVMPLAERFRAIAARIGDRGALASAERLVGTAHHSLGEEPVARSCLERMLALQAGAPGTSQIARFQVDQQAAALSVLGNVLWVLGYPERARRSMGEAMAAGRGAGHALSLMSALANAACLAVRAGLATAPALLDELDELLGRHAIAVLDGMRRSLRALLDLRAGDMRGEAALRAALAEMRATGFQYRYSIYAGMLAAELGAAGRRAEGLLLVDDALAFARGRKEGWCLAELVRIRGELLAPGDPQAAAACFARALEIAAPQQGRTWSLRAAASLARLEGGAGPGQQTLRAVYDGFEEGFDFPDLLRARTLLGAAG